MLEHLENHLKDIIWGIHNSLKTIILIIPLTIEPVKLYNHLLRKKIKNCSSDIKNIKEKKKHNYISCNILPAAWGRRNAINVKIWL